MSMVEYEKRVFLFIRGRESGMEFRKLARSRQQLSQEECIDLLRNEMRGVLSVHGDGGYPYGMPLNHWYCEEDGKLYFHSGKKGHRTDSMLADDRASYCVIDSGIREEGEWPLHFNTVIVFGRLSIVEDHEKALEISRRISLKFTQDQEYIENEILHFGDAVLCFSLTPEHICGKKVKES